MNSFEPDTARHGFGTAPVVGRLADKFEVDLPAAVLRTAPAQDRSVGQFDRFWATSLRSWIEQQDATNPKPENGE